MKKREISLNKNTIFKGNVITVNNDLVKCPNGNKAYREIVYHHGGVGVLAVINNKIIIERQYRYAYDEEIIEIPAGKLEINEDPYEAGKRELLEETGYFAKELIHLGNIYPTCGYSNEIIHLFLATSIEKQKRHLDEDEVIDFEFMELDEAIKLISNGKIKDAKTICAIHYYLNLKNK